jgi:hypothetical protein
VHAGSDIRRRWIVLDSALRGGELERVLAHELFHFVWVRLGNPSRRAWRDLLAAEADRGAWGELGWSAEWRKAAQAADYACESFCDTAAFLHTGRTDADRLLAPRFRARRAEWFRNQFGSGGIKL